MTEEEKWKTLSGAQCMFLIEIEMQLERFRTMNWLSAKRTKAPVADEVVWAREIDGLDVTLALSATREMLDACTIFIRAVSKPDRKFSLREERAVTSPALQATLADLVGYPPMTPSSRRPNQPLRRSHRSRR